MTPHDPVDHSVDAAASSRGIAADARGPGASQSFTSSTSGLSRRWKRLLSTLIVFHLLAVLLPPLAFQARGPDGPSPLIGAVIQPFEGYGQFLYMDRGYAFFAPDPGPSHLIQAAVREPDGTLNEAMFPDLQQQWPRLLYHRHFMLAEYLNEIYWPPGPPPDLAESDPEAAELWERRRQRYERLRQSIVQHLSAVHAGKQVAIRRIEHGLPALLDFIAEPIDLDDERLYRVLLDQPPYAEGETPAEGTEVVPPIQPGSEPGLPDSEPGRQPRGAAGDPPAAVPAAGEGRDAAGEGRDAAGEGREGLGVSPQTAAGGARS